MRKIPVGYLIDYAKAQVGNPYWYGTYGQILNSAVWRDNSKRYPKYYSDARKATARAREDYGKKGHDCSGLLKGALWTFPQAFNMPAKYTASEDKDANTMVKEATESGAIGTIPEIAGLAVWKNNHIGIYIGDGKVVEAKGFDYGVVESKLSDTKWTKWAKLSFVDYGEETASKPEPAKETGTSKETYTVVKGDTLSKIAKMWGTSVQAIAEANGIKNVNLIQVGQKLIRPTAPQSTPQTPSTAKDEKIPTETTWRAQVATQSLPLNIRAGAGTNYRVVGQLARNSYVTIEGENKNGWYKLADGRGYVSANYIKRA